DRGDTSGMSLLYELAHGRLSPHLNASVTGLRPEFQPLLAVFPSPGEIDALAAPPVRRSVFEEVGAHVVSMGHDVREQLTFLGGLVQDLATGLLSRRAMRWPEVAVVFEKAGVNAVPIVSLISLLTGVIIAFESAQPLAMFGAQVYTANILGISMVREFSPIF